MALDIGRIAYDAHDKYVSQHNREMRSKWEDVGKVEQDAWRHAAVAVLDCIHQCEEDMKKDPDFLIG